MITLVDFGWRGQALTEVRCTIHGWVGTLNTGALAQRAAEAHAQTHGCVLAAPA